MVLRAHDAGFLRVLVDEGREATKQHLQYATEAIEKYHGPYWTNRHRGRQAEDTPENTYFEYMTAMIPRLVFHAPRVRVASRRQGPQADVATAIRHGLNRLVRDAKLEVTLRDVALDMLFGYGVMLVKEAPREGLELAEDDPISPAKPTWPVAERIPPSKFFMDPQAYDWASTRYQGHEWRLDKEDLLERAKKAPKEGWIASEIEALAVDVDDEMGLEPSDRPANRISRQEVRAYDVWFPEIETEGFGPDEGFHGTIFTIAVGQSGTSIVGPDGKSPDREVRAGMIRKPRPFYGPRTGPYTLFGVYKVPDSPFPLSPLIAVEGLIRELNVHARVSSENMRKYKRMIGVKDRTTAERIKNNPHDNVAVLDADEPGRAVAQFEVAGISEHTLMYEERMKERTNRIVGMDETMRGTAGNPDLTATQSTLASESATARISEIKEAFVRAVTDVLYSEAHYLYYSDTAVFPISDEIFEEQKLPEFRGQDVRPWFRGGNPDRKGGYTFDDLELEIEPYSMERTSEGMQMQRMLQAHEILMGSLPMMSQYPDFPWKEWFKKLGDAMNLPALDDLVKPKMLERLTKMLAMMTQQMAQPQMIGPQGAKLGSQVSGGAAPTKPARSQASQGGGPPTAARSQGQGMPGQKMGGSTAAKPMARKVG